jgi:hypothetical protein
MQRHMTLFIHSVFYFTIIIGSLRFKIYIYTNDLFTRGITGSGLTIETRVTEGLLTFDCHSPNEKNTNCVTVRILLCEFI